MISSFSKSVRYNTNHNSYDEGKEQAARKVRESLLFDEYYYRQGMGWREAMAKAKLTVLGEQ